MSTRTRLIRRATGFVLLGSLFGCDTRYEGPDSTQPSDVSSETPAAAAAGTASTTPMGGGAGVGGGTASGAVGGGGAGGAAVTPQPSPPAQTPEPTPEPEPTPDPDYDPVITPDDGKLTILPLGDSITLGAQGGYRNDLFTWLQEDGFSVDMVGTQYDTSTEIADKDHEGHPGFTIANARAGVDGWLDAMAQPDVVLIMLGTNDEAWWTTKQPSETKDEMLSFVDHLLERLPQSALVVATIPPQTSANVEPINMDRAEMTKQYNALTKTAIEAHSEHGTRVFLADVNAVLGLSDLYDGIHPSREAHTKIAGVFYDVLSGIIAK